MGYMLSSELYVIKNIFFSSAYPLYSNLAYK
jgi:hypothetical protein